MSDQASLGDISGSEESSEESNRERENHITGFGSFPSEWSKEDLVEAANIRDSERIPINSKEREKKKPGNIPYYGANGKVDEINEFIFDGDFVLLAEDGGHFEEYQNRPVAYKISGKAWVNNHAHILEADDSVITNWLFYSLEHRNLVPYINGSTRSKLTKTMLKKVKIPVPEKDEQRRIASVLYNVDQAISKTEEIIEQTQRVKKGLMQDMILKGVDQVGEIQEMDESPVEDRELVKLGEVMTLEYGENLPEDDRNEGEVPVYGSNGPVDKHDEAYVEKEGIVIGRKGTIGGAVYSDSAFWPIDTTYYITEDETELKLKFLYYLINSLQLDRLNAASAIPGLNRNDAYGLKALVPDEETQAEIVEQLEAMDDLIEKKETEKEQLQRLKKGLMQDLLTGKVRTKNKDIEVLDEVMEVEG